MTPEDAVAYLVEHQLLAPHDFVRGDVRVFDQSSRNTGLHVRCTTLPGYFLKRGSAGNIAAEARFYESVRDTEPFAGLRPVVPALRRYDAGRDLLVLDLLRDAPTARSAARGSAHTSRLSALEQAAAPIGDALARCHAVARTGHAAARNGLRQMVPWAFNIAFPSPRDYADFSLLHLEILRLVQREPGITDRVRECRRQWTFECLTHGDVRWENILLVADADDASRTSVRLIDWEHVGLGDPAWDIACALQGWIAHGIDTLKLANDDTPATASAKFALALPELQQQMRAFWNGYRDGAASYGGLTTPLLQRSAALLPLRLLQTAWEWSRERRTMTPFIVLTTQLAINLFRRGPGAAIALTGIAGE